MLPLRSSFLDPWTGPKRRVGRKNLKSLAQFMEGIIGHEAVLDCSWLQIGVNSPSYWGSWSPVMNMFEMGSWICQIMQLFFCFFNMRFIILRLPCFRANLWNWDERGRFGWLNEWWSWLNRELPSWIFTTLYKQKSWQEPTWTEVEFWNVLNLNFEQRPLKNRVKSLQSLTSLIPFPRVTCFTLLYCN